MDTRIVLHPFAPRRRVVVVGLLKSKQYMVFID